MIYIISGQLDMIFGFKPEHQIMGRNGDQP
jgi:uncharacterized RmlC-like cupin family protein